MQRALVKAVVGAAAVIALVSACGSGGSNTSSGSGASGQNTAQSSGAAQPSGAAQSGEAGQNGASGQNGAPGQNSPAAQAVTAAIQQASQASPIKFEPEKAELTGQAKEGLAAIAKAMQGNDVKLKVETHAGYPDAEKAKKLSEQRAEAITSALEADGVAKDRVQAEPSGSEKAQGDQALDTQLSVAS
ncbi:OmpA family protein [Amycolatopsis echigonensis]|uniref:OmpA family protein n=1 Tax=Amycolatopsis echigonensis TaxID=2576905 RepID=A0A2N3WQG7_9PSEU|nr:MULTISPECIES: OmpA family protein [Amycolatopsis]MBB2500331.1 OmpA family protein [Amycolatopsis echigonensis]PKV96112.1 outer membrane protein OmpA-like peptidoglycan-associated protein [Amycolatopsis niigatensis]